jgi:UDP-N-acetylglucosamine 2-epimerase (non-hydrolysing)
LTDKIMLVFGTRPEAIKVAPLVDGLRRSDRFTPVVAVTAQHRSILDQVLDLFAIVPDHDLDIFQAGQTLGEVTTRSLERLIPVIEHERPAFLIVQGDTTTTFAAALAGFYTGVPVAHLEAGLRTGNVRSPFPEEMNRRLTSQLTSLHLAPTATARSALIREGVEPAQIVVTGNTVIDALMWTVARRVPYTDPALNDVDDDPRRVLLVTAHRRESWGSGMEAIGRALDRIATEEPDLLIVFPIHPNPLVRGAILPAVAAHPNARVVEPLPYGQFARLIDRSHLVLTDSGGVQEEAPALGKPVLVMRDTTERPEAVEAGTARLVGTDADLIVGAVRELLHDPSAYTAMANAVSPYGDGVAAGRAVQALEYALHGRAKPADFAPAGPVAGDDDPAPNGHVYQSVRQSLRTTGGRHL